MKLKAGMWFTNSDGDARVLMTSKPDSEGDLFYTGPFERGWDYTSPEWIEENWKPSRRAPWHVMPSLRHPRHFCDYTIRAIYSPDGRRAIILCGCKCWPSLEEARRHYETRNREFLTTEQNAAYNAWALRYLDRLEAKMKARRPTKISKQRRAA